MEKNLDRITVVISLLFAFNTLILGFLHRPVTAPLWLPAPSRACAKSPPSWRARACDSRLRPGGRLRLWRLNRNMFDVLVRILAVNAVLAILWVDILIERRRYGRHLASLPTRRDDGAH